MTSMVAAFARLVMAAPERSDLDFFRATIRPTMGAGVEVSLQRIAFVAARRSDEIAARVIAIGIRRDDPIGTVQALRAGMMQPAPEDRVQ